MLITKHDYFHRAQPAKSEELANSITVGVSPLVAGEADVVYKSNAEIVLGIGDSISIVASFSKSPIINAGAYLVGAEATTAITSETYYAHGAHLVIANAGGAPDSFTVEISGQPLEVQGAQFVTAEDAESINEHGLLSYSFPDNPFVQTKAMAQLIADTLLASYKLPRRDVSLDWRGNPALELVDEIEVPEYQKKGIDKRGIFRIVRQSMEFDGTLRATTDARKLTES